MLETVEVRTRKRAEFVDITGYVHDAVRKSGVERGSCMVFVPHTTAAVTINENADPDVVRDIERELSRIVPQNGRYSHSEGNSDAHIKASVLGASQMLPIQNGSLVLGTWQGIYFAEFDGPRQRRVHVQIVGSE